MLCCLNSMFDRESAMFKNFLTGSIGLIFLGGCAAEDHSQILTDKCIEDGLKAEGCACVIALMEEHLTKDDIKDLSKAAQSGDDSDSNFGRIDDQIQKKLRAQMEDLPPLERLKKVLMSALVWPTARPNFFD